VNIHVFFSRLLSALTLRRFKAITIPDSQSFYFSLVSRQLDVFMTNRQRKDDHTLAKLRNMNRRISKMALVVGEELIERDAIQMDLFNGRVALAKACHPRICYGRYSVRLRSTKALHHKDVSSQSKNRCKYTSYKLDPYP
jgi:hypothetical protein